jgi:hypothetical protein
MSMNIEFSEGEDLNLVYFAIDHFVKYGIGHRINMIQFMSHAEEKEKKEAVEEMHDMQEKLIDIQKRMEKIDPGLKEIREDTKSSEIKLSG